jgi:CHRD domain
VHVDFSGLVGTSTASHIHCCTADPQTGNAGVATTVPTFSMFPLGVTAGTYDTTLDLLSASSYNPAFVTAHGGTLASAEAALLAGLTAGSAYLNIHSSTYPTGEIRGFLIAAPIPEPGNLAMWAMGLAALVGASRWRRVAQAKS